MKKIQTILLSLVLLSNVFACILNAQQAESSHRDFYFPISIESGQLTGAGTERLLNQCKDSHFVLFGEAHGVAGVAEFVEATHRAIGHQPFYHLVLESGDWFTSELASHPFDETMDRYPYSLAFDYNGDLSLINNAKLAGGDRNQVTIGIDQEACAIHPFQFLSTNSDSFGGCQLSKCLLLKSLFLGGRYIRTPSFEGDLAALIERSSPNSSTIEIAQSVSESMTIFVNHVTGNIDESVVQRESRMMKMFDASVAKLKESGTNEPRFIFKMGGAHTVRGIGPNGVKTLGQHVAELAERGGQKSLHISIYPHRETSALPMPDEYKNSPYVLVDCKRYLNSIQSDQSDASNAELTKRLTKCDFVILMNNPGSASKSIIREKQKRFVRSQLLGFGLVLIPIVAVIPALFSGAFAAFRRVRGKHTKRPWPVNMLAWFSLILLAIVAAQIVLLVAFPSFATPSSMGIGHAIQCMSCAGCVALIYGGFKLPQSSEVTKGTKFIFWLGVAGCLGFAFFIHVWGIGHLLGV